LPLLADVLEVLGDRQLSIGRELTKLHEEVWRGKASQAADHFEQGQIKGEITVVISGAEIDEAPWHETAVRSALIAEINRGFRRKDAVALVAQMSGWPKRKVYRLSLDFD
jgi:16S rRNA (cytidine1402-2'-O)-methyltransferase